MTTTAITADQVKQLREKTGAGMTWDVTFLAPNERRVQLRVTAGSVYWVGIWSAEAPGEPFVLTASLQED